MSGSKTRSRDVLIGSDGPERLAGRRIRLPLPCQRCRYDLQGLFATGVCPECGTPATRSLAAVIDPPSHRLPPLLAPRMVGSGLATLGCLFLVAAIMLALNRVLVIMPVTGLAPRAVPNGARVSLVIAMFCGFLAWRPVVQLWPTPGTVDPRKGRSGLGLLSIGLVVWIGGVLLLWPGLLTAVDGFTLWLLVSLTGGVFGLEGLRRILIEVGTRSRLFRTDLIRRQRVRDLVAGIVFIELGVVLYSIGGWQTTRGAPSWGDMFQTFGIAVSLVASLLVLVGLIYLCMNLFWIRQALLSPPRRLREYLDPPMESSGP